MHFQKSTMANLICINVNIKHRSSNNWDSFSIRTELFRYYEKYNLLMVFSSALTIYKVTEECPSPELIVTADIILSHLSKRSTFYQPFNIGRKSDECTLSPLLCQSSGHYLNA